MAEAVEAPTGGTEPDNKDGVYFDDPALPEGWVRKCVQRSTGQSAGHWDVYVYNPMGKKFRTQLEVRRYLEEIGSDLDPARFSFNAYSLAGQPPRRKSVGVSHPSSNTSDQSPNAAASPAEGAGPGRPSKPASPGLRTQAKSLAKKAVIRAKGKPGPKPKLQTNGDTNQKLKLKFNFAKRRLRPSGLGIDENRRWIPPRSPYGLMQETYFEDPWKMLVGTILISRSSGVSPAEVWGEVPPVSDSRRVLPVLEQFFLRWPNATAARDGDHTFMEEVLQPLGQPEKHAHTLIRFSDEYLSKVWKYPNELYGIGRYGNDSYRIFCVDEWKQVVPYDHLLNLYHNWLWTNHQALGV